MTDAARAGDDKLVEQHLNDYSNTISDAHLTMMKSGKTRTNIRQVSRISKSHCGNSNASLAMPAN